MRRDMVRSLIPVCLVLALLCGCSLKVPEPLLVSLSGTYVGDLEDHGPIRLTLTKAERGYSGYGTLDGKPISISLLTSHRGLGVLTYEENTMPAAAELSIDGDTLTLTVLGKPVDLRRNGLPVAPSPGPFTGRFRSGGMRDFAGAIDLVQNGNLVVGTGNVYGQTIALSGIVEAGTSLKGRAIFTDGSQALIMAELSNGDRLTVTGLGGLLEFKR